LDVIKDKNFLITFLASLGVEATKSVSIPVVKHIKAKALKLYSSVLRKNNIPDNFAKQLEKEEIKEKLAEFVALEVEKYINEKLTEDDNVKEKLSDLENFLKFDIEKMLIENNIKAIVNVNIENNNLDNGSSINSNINIS
jgi:hypothetical protein